MAKVNTAKTPQHADPEDEFAGDPESSHRPGPTAEEFEALRQQLFDLHGKYNELKQATGGVELLAPEEVPVYEIGEGSYYSPDDILYPPGAIIEDLTGRIIPNEGMIPVNSAAEERMAMMLQQLPEGGNTPSHELIIEAAAMVVPSFDARGLNPLEARAELQKMILDQAMRLRMKQAGMLPQDVKPRLYVKPPAQGTVPLMSNTRIKQGSEVNLRSQVAGPMPSRGAAQTRMRTAPIAPANKAASPMGTVQNQTLGTR